MSELMERIDARFEFVEEKLKNYIVDEETGCWNWQGKIKTTRGGYGQITLYMRDRNPKKRTFATHRVSYAFHNGEDPKSLCVLHSCDNPSCMNPDHLSLGTHADNMRDMVEKGRSGVGVKNPSCRLSEGVVVDIVEKIKQGKTNIEIASLYPISHAQVSMIRTGKSWKHLTESIGYIPADHQKFVRSTTGVTV